MSLAARKLSKAFSYINAQAVRDTWVLDEGDWDAAVLFWRALCEYQKHRERGRMGRWRIMSR